MTNAHFTAVNLNTNTNANIPTSLAITKHCVKERSREVWINPRIRMKRFSNERNVSFHVKKHIENKK